MPNQSPDFESIAQKNVHGEAYWSARDLAPLLGYKKWQRFEDAIKRAIDSCQTNGNAVEQHFAEANKISKSWQMRSRKF